MHRRDTPPPPLEREDLGCCFLVGNGEFGVLIFPSGEGIKGCVMVRSAVWVEEFCCCLARRYLSNISDSF